MTNLPQQPLTFIGHIRRLIVRSEYFWFKASSVDTHEQLRAKYPFIKGCILNMA